MNLEELLDAAESDDWRGNRPFSPDVESAHDELFSAGASRLQQAQVLSHWVKKNQPCLFGRMAAEAEIAYCILTEADVLKGDSYVKDLIHQNRLVWRRNALIGRQHAFVIALISPVIAKARPGVVLRDIALRLCQLYLSDESITTDKIFLDSLPLEIRRPDLHEFRIWRAGVNVFSAAGDQTWWHDHRLPGGLSRSL